MSNSVVDIQRGTMVKWEMDDIHKAFLKKFVFIQGTSKEGQWRE